MRHGCAIREVVKWGGYPRIGMVVIEGNSDKIEGQKVTR